MNTVHEVLLECTHRMCYYYILKNLLQKYGVEGLKDIFWDVEKFINIGEYRLAMEKLKEKS